jgi:hypothetical protein
MRITGAAGSRTGAVSNRQRGDRGATRRRDRTVEAAMSIQSENATHRPVRHFVRHYV